MLYLYQEQTHLYLRDILHVQHLLLKQFGNRKSLKKAVGHKFYSKPLVSYQKKFQDRILPNENISIYTEDKKARVSFVLRIESAQY